MRRRRMWEELKYIIYMMNKNENEKIMVKNENRRMRRKKKVK